MMITLGNRIVALIAGAGVAVGVATMTPPVTVIATTVATTTGARPVSARPVSARPVSAGIAAQDAVVRYWTPARMAAAALVTTLPIRPKAKPHQKAGAPVKAKAHPKAHARPKAKASPKAAVQAPARTRWLTGDTAGYGLRWTHGGAVANAVGKVFFTLGGLAYACTGALVNSANVDVVLTAAHCVSGGLERGGRTEWAADWLFVPGYRGGEQPYGAYTARRFFISRLWTGPAVGREADDVAFVQVGPAPQNTAPHVPVPPHGLTGRFAAQSAPLPLTRAYVFGFPQEPPYTGLYPNFCAGPAGSADGSVRTDCEMTAGDSGGPWFGQFSPRTGTGTIVAVTTYKLAGNTRVLYGAALGPLARALYQRASRWR
jgi:V8-like Glu-specific endopeptidase